MRSIRRLAVVTGTLVLASACGDGGGTTPPDNLAPVANFTAPSCTVNVECTFTSTSTDDVAVTEHRWDLNGDGTPDKSGVTVTNTYAAAGTVTVILTAVDAGGLTGTKTNLVTVSAAPVVNAAPVANFTAPTGCVAGTACNFTSTSTDDVAVTGWSWDFNGDGTADANTATFAYTYAAAGTYQAKLTVTDGGTPPLSDDVTQTVTVSPPLAQACTTAGVNVNCTLDITSRSTIKVTLTAVDCELNGSRLTIPPPNGKTIFDRVCLRSAGEVVTITDAAGAPRIFEAGSQLTIRFTQGDIDVGDPTPGLPAATLEGPFGDWTIEIDDGGNPDGTGEPDFTDVILSVEATLAP
jgi:PKD repeat protein